MTRNVEGGGGLVTRGSSTWVRRLSFTAVLVLAAIAPGPASGSSSVLCSKAGCEVAGMVQWAQLLPGSWVARNGGAGTTPARGQAYAALDGQLAVLGAGMTVYAFAARDGQPLWVSTLTGFPAGSAIMSVRAWPGVVTAGVRLPASGATAAGERASHGGRAEVVLRATDGRRVRVYSAAPFGGAVSAVPASTVIVGTHAVTSYVNRTGRVRWRRPTGAQPQAWRKDGDVLYVTVAAGGYLGTAPVTALRQINLSTGAERLVRPDAHSFAGRLSLAFDGVVLFTGARGVTAYSGTTGTLLWHRAGALPQGVDSVARRLYLLTGNVLTGVDPLTGATLARVAGAAAATSSGLYGVRAGAVLGLDHGALGKAWGYSVAAQRVVWTSGPLPWPHYFVGLSGIGGSASPAQDSVLLAICAQAGAPLAGNAGQRCTRPELVNLNR